MGEVVLLDQITSLDLPADRVLETAIEQELESVVVIGYTKEGQEYFASSIADAADCCWLVDRFKRALHRICDEGLPTNERYI